MARDYTDICGRCGRAVLPDEVGYLIGTASSVLCSDCYNPAIGAWFSVVEAVDTPVSRAMRRLAGIQRYEMEDKSRCWEPWQDLEEHPAGEWVRYDEVVAFLVEQAKEAK